MIVMCSFVESVAHMLVHEYLSGWKVDAYKSMCGLYSNGRVAERGRRQWKRICDVKSGVSSTSSMPRHVHTTFGMGTKDTYVPVCVANSSVSKRSRLEKSLCKTRPRKKAGCNVKFSLSRENWAQIAQTPRESWKTGGTSKKVNCVRWISSLRGLALSWLLIDTVGTVSNLTSARVGRNFSC